MILFNFVLEIPEIAFKAGVGNKVSRGITKKAIQTWALKNKVKEDPYVIFDGEVEMLKDLLEGLE